MDEAIERGAGCLLSSEKMPILHEEITEYPDRLLEESQPDSDHRWFVVYTRSRHEKALARHLYANSLSFYLPLVQKVQFIRGRKVRSYLPVFSSYLFYFGEAPDDIAKLAPYCVSRVLPIADQQKFLSEIQCIHSLLDAGIALTIEARLAPGRKVRVMSGVLQGLEGTIIRRKNGNRLLIAVSYLQQGVSVEISDFMVETI